MRRIAFASLLIVALVWALAGGHVGAAKSIRMPVDSGGIGLTAHPLVGDWLITTASGTVPAVFAADGAMMLDYPATAFGNDGFAFVSAAFGTWEPVGARGASFTAVQAISHANGVALGSVTIDGSLTMRDDPSVANVVASFTSITIRDPKNNIVSVTGAETHLPVMVGTRSPAEPAESPVVAARATDPAVIIGNGGRDCATCAVAYNLDSVAAAGLSSVASGSPIEVGAAEARYILAKDAALEPVAAASAAPSYGGGCNTCR